MVKHFGVTTREKSDGLKLTRDNYIKVRNISSFGSGKVYSDSFINDHTVDSLYNYDLNIKYYNSLLKQEFNNELMEFVSKTKFFKEITDLAPFDKVPGYYIMVLDEYSQAYIGRSDNIKKRIQSHWSKQKEFDRLIFGSKDNSILSIDSFRAYDTTRIFVYPTNELHGHEDNFINLFDKKYLLNRTSGGTLAGLDVALVNRKTREL
ncbi:hypothetical protein [Peribacillus frigoritolerans]|uniref:hypothetical protein n=1 Tax=Peribacillus frigoritolerans TaxID=450367 RepID=UPI0039A3A396